MTFDSNLAWREATAAISANRDVVLALAGVFFLLPTLALTLFFPQPPTDPGMSRDEVMALVSDYYVKIAPVAVPMAVFQAIGTLSLLVLLTDKGRPTVGEAIKGGARGILAYFLAQILFGIGVGLVGGTVIAIATLTGSAPAAAIGVMIAIAIVAYGFIRTSLSSPVIAIEGERNPVAALKRSWVLTKTHAGKIALFFLLVFVAFLIVITITSALVGILAALIAGPEGAAMVGAVLSSALNAIMALYFVAIIAAVHRQLAGRSSAEESAAFD